jgi:hypothetical protein
MTILEFHVTQALQEHRLAQAHMHHMAYRMWILRIEKSFLLRDQLRQ